MLRMSWMCKKIRKILRKTVYYQSSRICWKTAILHCQFPVLTSHGFHQSKAGTELLFCCADVRPRNLATELNWSVTHSMFLTVHATHSLRPLRICSHGNEQTAGQQTCDLQYVAVKVGDSSIYCFVLSLKASCSHYSAQGARRERYKDTVLAILDSKNSCHSILAKIFATTPLGNNKKKIIKKRKKTVFTYLS